MKKGLIIALCMAILSLFSMENANASFVKFNFNIEIHTGHKEWNADRTATECVNRGLCILKGGGGASTLASLVTIDNGNLGLAIKESDMDNRQIANLFDERGNIYVSMPIEFDDVLIALLQKNGCTANHINAGTYKPVAQNGYMVYDLKVKAK